MKPVRIQRSRQGKMHVLNGLPTVYVGRPTKWGNPYTIKTMMTRERAVEAYRLLIADIYFELAIKRELKDKNLSCWCPLDQVCHADILLEIANREDGDV